MIAADAREQVKGYLDIDTAVTDFDSNIDGFVLSGVKRLYPIAQREVDAVDVAITVDNGRAVVDLAASSLEGVRFVEAGEMGEPVDNYAHGTKLYLSDVPSHATTVKLFGLARFTLDTIAEELELAVVYFATAEFFKFLVGNKRKYNVYMNNGRAAVDNMQDLVDYYEGLANQHLADRITLYGTS